MSPCHRPIMLLVALIAVATVASLVISTGWHADPPRNSIQTAGEASPAMQTPTVEMLRGASGAMPQMMDSPPAREVAPPIELPGFWKVPSTERHQLLQSIAGITHHPPDLVHFLRLALRDRRADETLRNQIANILTQEEPLPKGLLEQFQHAASDPHETDLWRDYAVQHAAVLAKRSADPGSVLAWLLRIVDEGKGSQRGTAMLHASRLAQVLHIPMPDGFFATAVRLAHGAQQPMNLRLAAVAVIGERRQRDRLPDIRDLAFGESDPVIIAAAIGCASLLGEPGGENWIDDFAAHADPTVRAAAEHARVRLAVMPKPASP